MGMGALSAQAITIAVGGVPEAAVQPAPVASVESPLQSGLVLQQELAASVELPLQSSLVLQQAPAAPVVQAQPASPQVQMPQPQTVQSAALPQEQPLITPGTASFEDWMPVAKKLAAKPVESLMGGLVLNDIGTLCALTEALRHTNINPKDIINQPISKGMLVVILRTKLFYHAQDVLARVKAARQRSLGPDAEEWFKVHEKQHQGLMSELSDLTTLLPFFHDYQRAVIQQANDELHKIKLPKASELKTLQEAAGSHEEDSKQLKLDPGGSAKTLGKLEPAPAETKESDSTEAAFAQWLPVVKALAKHSGKDMGKLKFSTIDTVSAFIGALQHTDLKPEQIPAHITHKKLAMLLRGKLVEHIKKVHVMVMRGSVYRFWDIKAHEEESPGKYEKSVALLKGQLADLRLIAPFFLKVEQAFIAQDNDTFKENILPKLQKLKASQAMPGVQNQKAAKEGVSPSPKTESKQEERTLYLQPDDPEEVPASAHKTPRRISGETGFIGAVKNVWQGLRASLPAGWPFALHRAPAAAPAQFRDFRDEEFDHLVDGISRNPDGTAAYDPGARPTAQQKERLRALFLSSNDPRVRVRLFDVFEYSLFGVIDIWGMVRWIYPDYADEIFEFYPFLKLVFDVEHFKGSMLSDPVLVRAWIENIRALKQSSPEQYQEMKGSLPQYHWAEKIPLVFPRAVRIADERKPGESFYYLPYALKDVEAESLVSKTVFLKAWLQIQDPEKARAQKKRYELFDRLINMNFQVLQSMASHAADMTRFAAKRILKRTGRMAELFARMKPRRGRAEEAKVGYSDVEERLRRGWAELLPGELLPEDLSEKMFELDAVHPRSRLHSLINWLHQKALALMGVSDNHYSDSSGRIEKGNQHLNLIYLGKKPLYEVFQRNPALKALWLRLDRIRAIHNDTFLLSEDRLWLHATLGCHSAEIFADVSDPDEGGMLRVRYMESNYPGSGMRLLLLASALEKFGIPAQVSGHEYLTVSWDKDHGLSSQRSLVELYPFVVQLLHDVSDVDLAFGSFINNKAFGKKNTEGIARRLGEIYAAEGGWPFEVSDVDASVIEKGLKAYEGKEPQRKALAGTLSAELARLGLPPIPSDVQFGQRTIENFFTVPIEEAAARGELEWDGMNAPRRKDYSPVDSLAEEALSDAQESAGRAEVLSSLPASVLEYEPIGKVGTLSAERAQLRLDDGHILTVQVLREPSSGRLAYAQTSVGSLGKVEPKVSPQALLELLRGSGYDAELGESLSLPQQAHIQDMLKAHIAGRPLGQAETLGLPASPGRGAFSVGPILFDKMSRVEGGILTVPYTNPDDMEAISRAAGVLTTGGGSLSHAAITTRELGLPSIILYAAHWKNDAQGSPFLSLRLNTLGSTREVQAGVQAAELNPIQDTTLRQGDLVRMDGHTGQVLLLEKAGDGPIQQAYRAIERLRSGSVQELEWTQGWSLEAERFLLDEARSDSRYAGEQAKILEALRANAAHLAQEEIRSLDGEAQAQAQPASSKSETKRKPLWSRLQKRLIGIEEQFRPKDWIAKLKDMFQPDPDPVVLGLRRERLMALLRRMIRRDGAEAGEDPAYQRLAALDSAERDRRLSEMTAKEPSLLDLEDIDDDMKPLVGGKSAKLGEMLQALAGQDASVPEGAALTIYAYKRFLKETGLEDKVRALAMELDVILNAPMDEAGRSKEIGRLSERIRQLLMTGKLDAGKGVGLDILKALEKHGFSDADARWAVRSSAIQEDSDDAAFAGAAESYLNLKPDEILGKVVENWASFWLPRGILYRQRQGLRSVDLLPATLIQKMTPADVSGVIFTRNPVDGKSEVVINAAYGLGEGVVSGKAAADVYVVRKHDGEEIRLPHAAYKLRRVEPKTDGASGTRLGLVPKDLRDKRALTRGQTRALARVAVAIEKSFGKPMDIEFTVYQGRIIILQARPITTR
jgi:hypothetical protein